MIYGLGWKPDVRIHEGTMAKFGAAGPMPDECMALMKHLEISPLPLNQSVTQTCVAHAAKACIFIRAREQKMGDVLTDILSIYTPARRLTAPIPARLEDEGLFPRDAVDVMSSEGIFAAEDPGDLDPAKVNDDLFLDQIEKAATHLVVGWRRIPDATAQSQELIDEMKAAIYAGYPIMFGTDLDGEYSRYAGGVYDRETSAQSVGRHMQTAIGWTRDGALVLNSWGDWGMGGLAVIGWRTMSSNFVSDRYALEIAPKV